MEKENEVLPFLIRYLKKLPLEGITNWNRIKEPLSPKGFFNGLDKFLEEWIAKPDNNDANALTVGKLHV